MKSYEMNLSEGKILPKMLVFTIPIVASSLLQLLFNAADIIVVGKFEGDSALSAVGSNTPLINLMVTFFMGLSVGVNVLASNYYGGQKKKKLSDTVHTAIMVGFLSGLLLTVVGVIFARQFLLWMDTPPEFIDLAEDYLRIYFLGMIANMVYNFGASILRAVGDTKRPLTYLMIAGVINVMLNLIFVAVFGMGVVGVAIATVASQGVSAALVVYCLMKENSDIRLDLKKLRVDRDICIGILKIGLPASIQGVIFSMSNVIIQTSVNGFGDVVVGGNTAGANIEGFVYVSMNAFYQAAISFVGQSIGAGKKDRVTRIMLVSESCVLATGLVLGMAVVAFGPQLLRIYTDSPERIAYGMDRINIICKSYFLCGMMDVMVGVLRGMGYSIMPMLVSLFGVCGIRLIWIFTAFQTEAFHTPFWLYITYPVSWIVTLTAHFMCFMILRKKLLK